MNTVINDMKFNKYCWLKYNGKFVGQRGFHDEDENCFMDDMFPEYPINDTSDNMGLFTIEVDENLYTDSNKRLKDAGEVFEFCFPNNSGDDYRFYKKANQDALNKISDLLKNINAFLYGMNILKKLGIVMINEVNYDFDNYCVKINVSSVYESATIKSLTFLNLSEYIDNIVSLENLSSFSITLSYQDSFPVSNKSILKYLEENSDEKADNSYESNKIFFYFPYLNKDHNLIACEKVACWSCNEKVSLCKKYISQFYKIMLNETALSILTEENFDDFNLSISEISKKHLKFKYIPNIENDTALSLEDVFQTIYETLCNDNTGVLKRMKEEDFDSYMLYIPHPALDMKINDNYEVEFYFDFNFGSAYGFTVREFNN